MQGRHNACADEPRELAMRCLAGLSALSIAVLLTLPTTGVVCGGGAEAPDDPRVAAAFAALLADSRVAKALDGIKADDARTLQDQIRITEIPAPPFMESARANYFAKQLREFGLTDATIDGEGNVVALRKGSGGRPKVVFSAHLDTVFPEGTDVTVREWAETYYAPGIGDDSRGLAVVLSVLRALEAAGLKTVGDVLFVGTVGEEERGNLRGVKALFREHPDIDGFISVDGIEISVIVDRATASKRYEVTFRGPGGHSSAEFGLPSAVHAMARAIAKIADLRTPAESITTFTVGTVVGGTAVNAIAAEAVLTIDMRSESAEDLRKLETRVLELVQEAVREEEARWDVERLDIEIELIGNRPGGFMPRFAPIVQATRRAIQSVLKSPRIVFSGMSSDANVAMSLGVPAVTIGGGGKGGNWHSLNEWYENKDAYLGPQHALLLLLTLAGLEGVSEPVLTARQTP
jgi:tripeptide aminopeptidase